jgi:hypothetical protein
LNPLWPEPNQVYAVAVSAVTDGNKLAVLLQWRDELPQNTAIRVQDFQDGAAVQLSMTSKCGFLGMGDAQTQSTSGTGKLVGRQKSPAKSRRNTPSTTPCT